MYLTELNQVRDGSPYFFLKLLAGAYLTGQAGHIKPLDNFETPGAEFMSEVANKAPPMPFK